MHTRIYWLIVLMLGSKGSPANTYEYCRNEQSLCGKDQSHIICDPEQIVPDGKLMGIAPMTDKVKKLVLYEHNRHRNDIACGYKFDNKGNDYINATRMRMLIWDDELAYVAQAHAKRCNMTHDKCRNTVRFPNSGQNIALKKSSKKVKLLDDLTNQIEAWYEEYHLRETPIDLFYDFTNIGHFTLMMNDHVSRVGCAVALCIKDDDDMKYRYHTTCNYEYNNVENELPYTEGIPGADCEHWGGAALSDEYTCLCENTGEIFPN